MKDYTTNNYCNFLWINDLLEIKRDQKNVFTLEVLKDQKISLITVSNVNVFGTIVEVKQVGCKEYLYQLDDGTGVIGCKHSVKQCEEIINEIESEQVNVLHQVSETEHCLDQSSVVDNSADDSVFNDRSLQIEEVDINKKCKLKGLLTVWDNIYKSFSCLLEPYNIGDFVFIQGKLYTYFNVIQIYINKIRAVDLLEEIMLISLKLEDNFEHSKNTKIAEIQSDSEKRLSGLITFDNIPHLNAKMSMFRNTETLNELDTNVLNSPPEIVTPDLEPTITFDTFIK